MQSNIIYQETNLYESFTAYIEDDGRTIYLYLQSEGNTEIPMKSVWICNKILAPLERNQDDFQNGLAPMLIQDEISEEHNCLEIQTEDVELVWTEEGDGVAFFYKNELYSFIPSWSGIENFYGYSKFAKKEALTTHPLFNSHFGAIPETVKKHKKFWEFRFEKKNWKQIQESRLSFLERNFDKHIKYWSADGNKFPPLGIALFQPTYQSDIDIYSTIGMSGQNMPQVELYHKDISSFAKVELIFAVDTTKEKKTENWIPHLIGDMIQYPWKMVNWFGQGHTILMPRSDPSALYVKFTNLIFKSLNHIKEFSGLKAEDDFSVQFLAILPISETEKSICQDKGSSYFFHLLLENEIDWIHKPDRREIY